MSFLLADIYSDVDVRTGQVARATENAKLVTTSQDRTLLLLYVKEAGVEAARKVPQLTQRHRWVTTIGEGCYAVSPSVLAPRFCTYDGDELTLVDGHRARSLSEKNPNDTPGEYGLIGNDVWINPAPKVSKELILFYRPAAIIGQSDYTFETDEEVEDDILKSVPDTWRRPLVSYIVGKWLVENNEPERATLFLQEWAAWLIEESMDRRGAKTTQRRARYF